LIVAKKNEATGPEKPQAYQSAFRTLRKAITKPS
jgi:hypothetical protein